jgi:hypothetical protein
MRKLRPQSATSCVHYQLCRSCKSKYRNAVGCPTAALPQLNEDDQQKQEQQTILLWWSRGNLGSDFGSNFGFDPGRQSVYVSPSPNVRVLYVN